MANLMLSVMGAFAEFERALLRERQRFAMPHKVLQRTDSTRFNDFALEFYSSPIECTDRVEPSVLDGVLYHESDLTSKSTTPTPTAIQRSTSPPSGWSACASARAFVACTSSVTIAPIWHAGTARPVRTAGGELPPHRRAVGPPRPLLRGVPAGHATASAVLQRLNPFLASNHFYAAKLGVRPRPEDRIRAAVHVRAATASQGAAGAAQGRAASRLGASTTLTENHTNRPFSAALHTPRARTLLLLPDRPL